jgi:hypothetical protein
VKDKKTSSERRELESAVERLTEEVRVLRQSIDEFREDFVHLLRNLPDNLPPPYAHLYSLAESFAVDTPELDEPPTPVVAAPAPQSPAKPSGNGGSSPKRKTLFE